MPSPRSATIILNSQMVPLGTLAPVLHNNHFELQTLFAPETDFKNCSPIDSDLVIVLGGPQSPYQLNEYPYLRDEIDLLRQRITQDLPTLGIALGAQLIACAAGAEVTPGTAPEIGWFDLTLLPNTSSLLTDFDKVLVWQNDFYLPPKNSTCLASASRYGCQAFQIGQTILGLQFHAEVTPNIIKDWVEVLDEDLEQAGIKPANFLADTNQYCQHMAEQATHLWQHWLTSLGKC